MEQSGNRTRSLWRGQLVEAGKKSDERRGIPEVIAGRRPECRKLHPKRYRLGMSEDLTLASVEVVESAPPLATLKEFGYRRAGNSEALPRSPRSCRGLTARQSASRMAQCRRSTRIGRCRTCHRDRPRSGLGGHPQVAWPGRRAMALDSLLVVAVPYSAGSHHHVDFAARLDEPARHSRATYRAMP